MLSIFSLNGFLKFMADFGIVCKFSKNCLLCCTSSTIKMTWKLNNQENDLSLNHVSGNYNFMKLSNSFPSHFVLTQLSKLNYWDKNTAL